jgi:hypothetical protein
MRKYAIHEQAEACRASGRRRADGVDTARKLAVKHAETLISTVSTPEPENTLSIFCWETSSARESGKRLLMLIHYNFQPRGHAWQL